MLFAKHTWFTHILFLEVHQYITQNIILTFVSCIFYYMYNEQISAYLIGRFYYTVLYYIALNKEQHNKNCRSSVQWFLHYEGRSEINASYFIMMAHDIRGECC